MMALILSIIGGAALYLLLKYLAYRDLRRLYLDFYARFPDRCFYCSFFRFGQSIGAINETPKHSPCKEEPEQ